MRAFFREKLERLLGRSSPPRVLDLFCGCGGLSLGFEAAGFTPLAGIDNDPRASESYAQNFHPRPDGGSDPFHACPRCVKDTDPLDFVAALQVSPRPETAVDVVVGGPPCQAYARIGRAKLREVKKHPEAYRLDERAYLFNSLVDYVALLKPVAVIMENVPEMMNYDGRNLARSICDKLCKLGYTVRYGILNAVHYGVPQLRERLFITAVAEEARVEPSLPPPSSYYEAPRGYHWARCCSAEGRPKDPYLVHATEPSVSLTPAVAAEEAIGDLSRVLEHLSLGSRTGRRRLDEFHAYPRHEELSQYAQQMRCWPRHASAGGVHAHVTRSLPRDYAIFERMSGGDEYPEAHAHALTLFKERLAEAGPQNPRLVSGTRAFEQLLRSTVPPYSTDKFPNKWWKIVADQPVRTLTAHLGKDTYSHIHYDSEQARTITVREAARLQSFPDGFRFAGGMNSAYRQIGNSVPPLLAYAIAKHMLLVLRAGPGLRAFEQ